MTLSNIISIRIWSYTPTNKHWQDSLYNLRHNWDSIHSDIPVCPGPETAGSYIQAALFLHQDVAQHGHVSGENYHHFLILPWINYSWHRSDWFTLLWWAPCTYFFQFCCPQYSSGYWNLIGRFWMDSTLFLFLSPPLVSEIIFLETILIWQNFRFTSTGWTRKSFPNYTETFFVVHPVLLLFFQCSMFSKQIFRLCTRVAWVCICCLVWSSPLWLSQSSTTFLNSTSDFISTDTGLDSLYQPRIIYIGW